MILWIYNVLLVFGSPVWVPWMIWRARRRHEGPDWKQRTGEISVTPPARGVRRVWIHAVSVGEVMAVLPVLKAVKSMDGDIEIVLSTTTSTGQTAAREQASNWIDHLVYFPIDVPRFVLAALGRARPTVVAVMETELWPNFFWMAKRMGSKTLVLNGRLSARTLRKSWLARAFYGEVGKYVDKVLAQTAADAASFISLGFRDVADAGNTKFDAALDGLDRTTTWRAQLEIPEESRVIVVGSTRSEYEVKFVVDALMLAGILTNPDFNVIHAPRHLEASQFIIQTYQEAGVTSIARRTESKAATVTILDTIGELGSVYAIAEVAVVGGGFDTLGGQNIIQALAHGVPVVHGEHMTNFKEVCEGAKVAGATKEVKSSQDLAQALSLILENNEARKEMSENALKFVSSKRGAAKKCAEAIITAASD